jgi:hypothetical protein
MNAGALLKRNGHPETTNLAFPRSLAFKILEALGMVLASSPTGLSAACQEFSELQEGVRERWVG